MQQQQQFAPRRGTTQASQEPFATDETVPGGAVSRPQHQPPLAYGAMPQQQQQQQQQHQGVPYNGTPPPRGPANAAAGNTSGGGVYSPAAHQQQPPPYSQRPGAGASALHPPPATTAPAAQLSPQPFSQGQQQHLASPSAAAPPALSRQHNGGSKDGGAQHPFGPPPGTPQAPAQQPQQTAARLGPPPPAFSASGWQQQQQQPQLNGAADGGRQPYGPPPGAPPPLQHQQQQPQPQASHLMPPGPRPGPGPPLSGSAPLPQQLLRNGSSGGYRQQPFGMPPGAPPPSQQQQQHAALLPPPSQQSYYQQQRRQSPAYPQQLAQHPPPPYSQQQQQQQQQQGPPTGYATPGAPGGAAVSSAQQYSAPPPAGSRINPAQMPRPRLSADDGGAVQRYDTCTPEAMGKFPPASSEFMAVDEGNASPRYVRAVLRCVPATRDALRAAALPLAVEVTPLAEPRNGEAPVPLVDFGAAGPPRCRICRAYINAYARFAAGGAQWACNLCGGALNDVDPAYRCALDGAGLRRDRAARAELCRGSVDFAVPAEYAVRPAQQPIYAFVIDASAAARASGFTAAAAAAAELALDALPGGAARARVGIAAFTGAVHFFDVSRDDAPRAAVAVDVDEPFAPLPAAAWLSPVAARRDALRSVLAALPELVGGGGGGGGGAAGRAPCVPVAALAAVADALRVEGGRVFLFAQGPSNVGMGAPARTEDLAAYGTEREPALYRAASDGAMRALAEQCALSQICVDVLLLSEGGAPFVDAASLCLAPHVTGGRAALLRGRARDKETARHLAAHVAGSLAQSAAAEAVLKVRCSPGLALRAYAAAPGLERVAGELELAGAGTALSVLCELQLEGGSGAPREGDHVFVQAALLYTCAATGRRLVRCHTLALPVSARLEAVFNAADVEAAAAALVRGAAAAALRDGGAAATPQQLCLSVTQRAVAALQAYRAKIAADTPAAQLILPESLRVLPLYALCAGKSVALRRNLGAEARFAPRADERAWHLYRLAGLPTRDVIATLYPRLYALQAVPPPPPEAAAAAAAVAAAAPIPPTAENLNSTEVFVLDTGAEFLLYLPRALPPATFVDLLGGSGGAAAALDSEVAPQLEGDGPVSHAVRGLVQRLRQRSSTAQPLRVAVANSGSAEEALFISLLVEDRTKHGSSYVDHLVALHKTIQTRLQ